MWMDTRYEPGTVKVVAYDNNGIAVAEKRSTQQGNRTVWCWKQTGM